MLMRLIAAHRLPWRCVRHTRGIFTLPLVVGASLLLGCVADPGPAGRPPPYSGPQPGGPLISSPPADSAAASGCPAPHAAVGPISACATWFRTSHAS